MKLVRVSQKISVLDDIKILIELPRHDRARLEGKTPSEKLIEIRKWIANFYNFMDGHIEFHGDNCPNIQIEEIYKDVCSVCKRNWEPYEDDSGLVVECPYCGSTVDMGE